MARRWWPDGDPMFTWWRMNVTWIVLLLSLIILVCLFLLILLWRRWGSLERVDCWSHFASLFSVDSIFFRTANLVLSRLIAHYFRSSRFNISTVAYSLVKVSKKPIFSRSDRIDFSNYFEYILSWTIILQQSFYL